MQEKKNYENKVYQVIMVNFDIFHGTFCQAQSLKMEGVDITLLATFLSALLDFEITLPNIYWSYEDKDWISLFQWS